MSFMVKKKRYKFQVRFEVEELSSVPFVNAMLFCKVRLLDGGSFSEFSSKEPVMNHLVCWRAKFDFPCKMNANANTGVLDSCTCRVSVRKELKGGKSYQKLGFADVNLAEFAGGGLTSRKYLLEGYDSKRRQDNSTLKLNIDISLLSGDPLFKTPTSRGLQTAGLREEDLLQPENKGASEDPSGESVASATSSGFSSLPRKNKPLVSEGSTITEEGGVADTGVTGVMQSPGHQRSASGTSQQSKVSGYSSSNNHSRQSSTGEARTVQPTPSPYGSLTKPESRLKKRELAGSSIERRVDSTRVDNDELVNELVNSFADRLDESGEPSGLQLYITKDGQPVLSGPNQRDLYSAGRCERVIFDTPKS